MNVEKPKEKYDQLIADGYCVIKDVLKEEMLNQLRSVTDELLDAQTEDERGCLSFLWEYDQCVYASTVRGTRRLPTRPAVS